MKAELKINDKKEVVVTTTTDFQKSVEPEVGFVYRRKSVKDSSYNFLIKLNESVTKETYTYFKVLVYSFMTDKWEDQGETIGTYDLKNYYVRVLGDVSELVESSHRALNGDLSVMPQLEEDDLPQEPGLVSRNVQSEALVGVVDKLSVLKNRSEELTYMANCIIESQKNSLMQTVIKNEYSIPEGPSSGMYQVEKYRFPNDPGKESLCIKYNPEGEYWDSFRSEWKERKNRITYLLDEDDLNYGGVINYDNVTFEEIDYYLKSRVDRSSYLEMFKPLIGLRDELLKDIEKEKDFVKMVAGETEKSESEVWEVLRWWKLKNKWKRSLTSDDSKAYRMIVKKLTKDVSRETL